MNSGSPASAAGARPSADRRFVLTSIAVFTALTSVFFWRYALAPATTVSDPGDPLFLIWTLEWVGRALTNAPTELFDAPMFHPLPDVLAYSDPLLPQAVIAVPLRLVGAGPIAAYNLVYLAGIALTGVFSSVLFFELTEHRLAALFGAAVATYPALRLFHLAHMQLQVTAFLPLVLLIAERLIRRPSLRGGVALALTLAAAALGSLYYGLFLALLLPLFVLTAWIRAPERSWKAALALGAGGASAALLLLPFARVYRRAIEHLGMTRGDHGFADLAHYLGVSPFAIVSRWLPGRVVRDAGPQWVGGGAAWLLPLFAVALLILLVRHISQRGSLVGFPSWARVAAPYVVLGCGALLLSFGPELRWNGAVVARNPVGDLTALPGVAQIRDFQRAGFIVAIGGGALVAILLAELAQRRRKRLSVVVFGFVAISTAAPAFSASLPAYEPPPAEAMPAVYRWLERQKEPIVLLESPLPAHSETEPFTYLWGAVHHKKRLVHGFSGYLPLTDAILRGEATGVHRADFFRSLALLGATRLVVHTDALAALPGGAASLAALRETRGGDRVARFKDAEVYRVPPAALVPEKRPAHVSRAPSYTSGSRDAKRPCFTIGQAAGALMLYAPAVERIGGVTFIAENALGEVDRALRIERSLDLRAWREVRHQPLLSTSLSEYLDRPTPVFRTRAVIPVEPGHFLRLSSRWDIRVRLCELTIDATREGAITSVPHQALKVETHAHGVAAPLAADGRLETRWHSAALQNGAEWVRVDLGRDRNVVAILLDLGKAPYDYARRLAVECLDGAAPAPTAHDIDGRNVRFDQPRALQIMPLSPPRTCRSVLIRQTGSATDNFWSVAEIGVLERPERLEDIPRAK